MCMHIYCVHINIQCLIQVSIFTFDQAIAIEFLGILSTKKDLRVAGMAPHLEAFDILLQLTPS